MGKALRILCAVLMLSLGFAHKPALAVAGPSAAYDEAYRLPDGTFAEICADHVVAKSVKHENGGHSGQGIRFCEACLLASSILVPVPDDGSWLRTNSASVENRLGHKADPASAISSHSPNARAPPLAGA